MGQYVPRTITDKAIQYPGRYTLTLVSGITYDLAAVPGTITDPGTAINKAYLQPIEDALGRASRAGKLYAYRNIGGAL